MPGARRTRHTNEYSCRARLRTLGKLRWDAAQGPSVPGGDALAAAWQPSSLMSTMGVLPWLPPGALQGLGKPTITQTCASTSHLHFFLWLPLPSEMLKEA